jgi:hypothetical protein
VFALLGLCGCQGVDVAVLWDNICDLVVRSLVCVDDVIPYQPNSFEVGVGEHERVRVGVRVCAGSEEAGEWGGEGGEGGKGGEGRGKREGGADALSHCRTVVQVWLREVSMPTAAAVIVIRGTHASMRAQGAVCPPSHFCVLVRLSHGIRARLG